MSRRTKASSLIVAIALTFMLLAVACSSGGNDDVSSADTVPLDDEIADAPREDEMSEGGQIGTESPPIGAPNGIGQPEGDVAGPSDGDDSSNQAPIPDLSSGNAESPPAREGIDTLAVEIETEPLNLNRDIIKTGTMEIETDDVIKTSAKAAAAIEGLGGAVFGQETVAGDTATTTFIFKVLPQDFGKAQAALARLGEVVSQSVSVDDVTDQVVDLESQMATAEASVVRLRAMLAQATDLSTIVQLEAQLRDRETTLASLCVLLRTLDDQVALSTIVLTVVEAVEPLPMPALEVIATAVGERTTVCPGEESLVLTGDTEVTVCVEVTNTGDTTLSNLDISTTGIDLDADAFEVIFGDDTKVEPSDKVVFAATTEVTESELVTASVAATYGDEDSATVGGRSSVDIDVDRPSTLPGFADSFDRGGDVVAKIFGILLIGLGVLLPFSWLLIPVALLWGYRRHTGNPEASAS